VETFLKYLQDAGPFTAPLCAAMAYALYWMNKERSRAWDTAEKLRVEANALREKRAGDLEKAAREYAEFGEATRLTLREWTDAAKAFMARGTGA
jgi:hypothetical protein